MVYIKDIPVLTGKAAEKFLEMNERNLERKHTVDFSKEAANSYAILNKRKLNCQYKKHLK